MKMSVKCLEDTIEGACGVSNIWCFEKKQYGDTIPDYPLGGAGWVFASFVPTKVCYQAYKEMCEKYTLVYQSPVRLNRNSGRDFFFCIFDARKS